MLEEFGNGLSDLVEGFYNFWFFLAKYYWLMRCTKGIELGFVDKVVAMNGLTYATYRIHFDPVNVISELGLYWLSESFCIFYFFMILFLQKQLCGIMDLGFGIMDLGIGFGIWDVGFGIYNIEIFTISFNVIRFVYILYLDIGTRKVCVRTVIWGDT